MSNMVMLSRVEKVNYYYTMNKIHSKGSNTSSTAFTSSTNSLGKDIVVVKDDGFCIDHSRSSLMLQKQKGTAGVVDAKVDKV